MASGSAPVRRISRHSPAISSRASTDHSGRARARYAAGRPLVANSCPASDINRSPTSIASDLAAATGTTRPTAYGGAQGDMRLWAGHAAADCRR
ncbi:hypothetical protein SANTM175S_08377 [Streptomyces antimycoticus]